MSYRVNFFDQNNHDSYDIVLPERKYKRLCEELIYRQDGEDIIVTLVGVTENGEFIQKDEMIGGLWEDEYYEIDRRLKILENYK